MSKQHYINNLDFLNAILEYKAAVRDAENSGEPKPQIPDYVGECILKIAERLSHKPNFINYCVDENTEALTKRGWVKYDSISTDDMILSYDQATNKLVWTEVLDVFRNHEYDGLMHYLTNRSLDAMVTPNHRFQTRERGLVPVEHLKLNDHLVLLGEEVFQDSQVWSDNFVKLVGWSISEGHYKTGNKSNTISILQVEGDKANEIRAALNAELVPFKEYTYPEKNNIVKWHLKTSNFTKQIHKVSPNRVLTSEFIISLTNKQRHLLIETMVKNDGWIRPNGGMSYCQKDVHHIDQFIFLCTLAGYRTKTTLRQHMSFGKPTTFYNVNLYSISGAKRYTCRVEKVNFHGGYNSIKGEKCIPKALIPNHPTVAYTGTVWCPKTKYGCFVCRRNGQVYITGNTYRDDMISDGIENCLMYFDSFDPNKSSNPFAYFTQIIYYAFIRRIQKEKKQTLIKGKIVLDMPFDLYDLQIHDEEGTTVNSYIEYMQQSGVYNDLIDKEEQRRAKVRSKKIATLDEFIEQVNIIEEFNAE